MKELYNLISKYKENKSCVVISGIDGDIAGEKLLIVEGQSAYMTQKAGVLLECLTEVQNAKDMVNDHMQVQSGMVTGICQTTSGQAFVEQLPTNSRIIVCGAGTVGQEVIKLGKQLGYEVIVLEDRQEFADVAKKLGADEVICMDFADGFAELEQRDTDYYVVVTREHKYDRLCLMTILKRRNAYIGMMASRNRATILKNDLKAEGFDAESVDKIHSPIGLSIKAETPAEIAVSIFAEIIQNKNSIVVSEGYKSEMLEQILASSEGSVILATIVKRTGSAPRDVGTKMLIYENGSFVGSVGGGWIEANVLEKARDMFANGQKHNVYETDKNSEDAILCGGYETIFLEMV